MTMALVDSDNTPNAPVIGYGPKCSTNDEGEILKNEEKWIFSYKSHVLKPVDFLFRKLKISRN